MSELNLAQLKEVYEAARLRMEENKIKRQEIHKQFLSRLKESSDRFQVELSEEIDHHLLRSATNACKKIRWSSRFNFNESFGNVKVSTLVYGWRTPDSWDISMFKEIGINGSPFEELVNNYKKKGIDIKNISNRNKGFGFWIEASFDFTADDKKSEVSCLPMKQN